MAIHFTFIASFVMPWKISYQHQWEELKNSHLGVSITSNVITSNDITSIVITSNDLFVMCSIAQEWLMKEGVMNRYLYSNATGLATRLLLKKMSSSVRQFSLKAAASCVLLKFPF